MLKTTFGDGKKRGDSRTGRSTSFYEGGIWVGKGGPTRGDGIDLGDHQKGKNFRVTWVRSPPKNRQGRSSYESYHK